METALHLRIRRAQVLAVKPWKCISVIYFLTSYPQLVSSASITSWGRVRPSRPNQILVASDVSLFESQVDVLLLRTPQVVQTGGQALRWRDSRQADYRRHVLHAAIIVCHESMHRARIQLVSIDAKKSNLMRFRASYIR